jgi:hypothetical protein
MTQQLYMQEQWYLLLFNVCKTTQRKQAAQALGVSAATVTQVLNGTGLYGAGKASTDAIKAKVMHRYGAFECPHLTDLFGEARIITSDECRMHASRTTVPIGSPGAMAHWRACGNCAHKPQVLPAVVKPPRSRKAKAPDNAPPAKAASTAVHTPVSTSEASTHEA